MDAALFEILLNEDEGVTLDVKQKQYRFVRASPEEKSELMKDLLGFANAVRRTDAYILIGVEEVRGGRSKVLGISEHLDDHSMQQFVAHNTNRTIHFHYEAFTFEGTTLGIIRIDVAQNRPLSLTRDMGQLKKGEVYLRRGSYTDPTKPATADEIALMGRAAALGTRRAELDVTWADVDHDKALGVDVTWAASALRTPPPSEIPDYHVSGSFPDVRYERANPDFYRELAVYASFLNLYRSMRLLIENIGSAPADDVRVELEVTSASGVSLKEDEPSEPARTNVMGLRSNVLHDVRDRRGPVMEPGDVSVVESKSSARLEVDCGRMQPGRRVWSEKFYVAVHESGPTTIAGRILAASLERPIRSHDRRDDRIGRCVLRNIEDVCR